MKPLIQAECFERLRIPVARYGKDDGWTGGRLTDAEADAVERDLRELIRSMGMPGLLEQRDVDHDRDLRGMRVALARDGKKPYLAWIEAGEYFAIPVSEDGINFIISPDFPAKVRRRAEADAKARRQLWDALTPSERASMVMLARRPAAERPGLENLLNEFQGLLNSNVTPTPELLEMLDPRRAPPRDVVARARQKNAAHLKYLNEAKAIDEKGL